MPPQPPIPSLNGLGQYVGRRLDSIQYGSEKYEPADARLETSQYDQMIFARHHRDQRVAFEPRVS